MNTQDLSLSRWSGWISLQSKGLSKSLLQHHSSKASIFQRSAFFTVQLSHPYMTTGKTIALTRGTFVGKVMSLLFNMLSRLVITFLPRSKRLLISWLQSLGSNTSLLIKIGTTAINTLCHREIKFVYSCSVNSHGFGFNELLESIFCLLLVVEVFLLQKVVR